LLDKGKMHHNNTNDLFIFFLFLNIHPQRGKSSA
jgi:hypothetical protein